QPRRRRQSHRAGRAARDRADRRPAGQPGAQRGPGVLRTAPVAAGEPDRGAAGGDAIRAGARIHWAAPITQFERRGGPLVTTARTRRYPNRTARPVAANQGINTASPPSL